MTGDGPWEMDVRAAIAGVIPAGTPDYHVDAAVKQAESTILAAIVAGWPVSSGKSLNGFHISGDVIENHVDYTEFVLDGLVETLAADGLAQAEAEVAKTLADIAARAAAKAGTAPKSTGKIAQVLARAGTPDKAVSALAEGRVAEAVAVYRASVTAARYSTFIEAMGLPAGTTSVAKSLATAGRVTEAINLLDKAGRTSAAQSLRSFSRTV